jgi:hypothetical protein
MKVVFALCTVAMGCLAPAPQPVRHVSSFSCAGPTEPPPAAPSVPMGRIEVTKLGEGPDGPRLRVVAENASAATLATKIGEAVNVLTRVDHQLDAVPVSLYVPDMSLDLLAAVLRTQKIKLSHGDWTKDHVLVFERATTYGDLADPAPLETQIFASSVKMSAEQVASLYCRSVAGPHGWAQVVGDRVMIMDRRASLDRFSEMLERTQQLLPAR